MHSLGWIATLAPLAAAQLLSRAKEPGNARWIAAAAVALALAAALATLASPVALYGVGRVPMILFAGLALVTVLTLPRQDATASELSSLLVLVAGTELFYAAVNDLFLICGYMLAVLPFATRRQPQSSFLLAASCVALGAALWFHTFWLLLAAVALRKGLLPLQSSITAPFERGPLGTIGLFFNGHLGAFLLLRVAAEGSDRQWLPLVGAVALLASVIVAVAGLVETLPRRVLALVAASQAGCILAGLVSSSAEGVQGALMQWIVVGLSSTGMFAVCRLIETRYGGVITGREFLGLAERFPKLAVFFAVCALAMVGLPGTLGFPAEDLLVHGVMETHAYVGILLPLAAGLNAFTLLRLFSMLFLGRRVAGLEIVPDALPRERWPLAALVLVLVIGGLAPGFVAALDTPAANAVTRSGH